MEDDLSVYERPYDAARPVLCVDEARKELRTTPRGTLPVQPGKAKREDYEYERAGWANLFLAVEPLVGQRHIEVTERRTAVDFDPPPIWRTGSLHGHRPRLPLLIPSLKLRRTQIAQRRVAPRPVVPNFYPLKERPSCLGARRELNPINELPLEAGKKALYGSVVKTVALPTHAAKDASIR